MIGDVLTVMWKERKGVLGARGNRRGMLWLVAAMGIQAVYGPLRDGAS